MSDSVLAVPNTFPILIVDDNRLQRSVLEAKLY
jgi:hypothetical protein